MMPGRRDAVDVMPRRLDAGDVAPESWAPKDGN